MTMKTGELVILWIGGLLSVAAVARIFSYQPQLIGASGIGVVVVQVMGLVAAIWIICGLIWATIYKRKKL
jgi:preprotein translocase subunit SecG